VRKIVINSVADVRNEPAKSSLVRGKDPLQETQVLYGDCVEVEDERDGWSKVHISDQLKFDKELGFIGYPGWIETHNLSSIHNPPVFNACISAKWARVHVPGKPDLLLSMGTKLCVRDHPTKKDFLEVTLLDGAIGEIEKTAIEKKSLLDRGLQLVGDPYLWGGYSVYNTALSEPLTGVDCSGLVHMLYRMQGTILPRNASDQLRVTKAVSGYDLKPGDLIFLKNLASNRLYHVMLYVGEDTILEATMISNTVRLITGKERLGAPITTLTSGHVFDNTEFFFGKVCTP
jgi:gamma-D-glutamyl-L-lysine dipeptidyl-peptidase